MSSPRTRNWDHCTACGSGIQPRMLDERAMGLCTPCITAEGLVNLDEVLRCGRCHMEKPVGRFSPEERARAADRRCLACREEVSEFRRGREEAAALLVAVKPQPPPVAPRADQHPTDLFSCVLYGCRLMFRACLERRAKRAEQLAVVVLADESGRPGRTYDKCDDDCEQGKVNAAHFAGVVEVRQVQRGTKRRLEVVDPRHELTTALEAAQETITMAKVVQEADASTCARGCGNPRHRGRCNGTTGKTITPPAFSIWAPKSTPAPKYAKQDLPETRDLPNWYVAEVVRESRRRVVELVAALDVGVRKPDADHLAVVSVPAPADVTEVKQLEAKPPEAA